VENIITRAFDEVATPISLRWHAAAARRSAMSPFRNPQQLAWDLHLKRPAHETLAGRKTRLLPDEANGRRTRGEER